MTQLVTSSGAFDKSAIMRLALSQCWTLRTNAVRVGPCALDIEFRVERVYCRAKLSTALKSAWRLARKQRLDWIVAQPDAVAAQQARDAATCARHAREAAQVRAEMSAINLAIGELPLPLAA